MSDKPVDLTELRDYYASDLEEILNDTHTWLPSWVAAGQGRAVVEELRDLCNEILADCELT